MYPANLSQEHRNVPTSQMKTQPLSQWPRLTLPPGIDDKIFFDDDLPGFGLRLRRSGDRSWWVQYAMAERTRKLRLGSVAELDISKARSTAKDVLARVRLGGDPAHEKRAGRVLAGETVGALLPAFLERQRARLKPRSYVEIDAAPQRALQAAAPFGHHRAGPSHHRDALGPDRQDERPGDSQPGPQPACRRSSRGARARVTSTPTRRPTPTRRSRTAGAIAC